MIHPYQVEISGICNLFCRYCPSPTLKRKRSMMGRKTWEAVLEICQKSETKKSIRLHHIGEPLLHKNIIEWTQEICAIMPFVILSTNGTLLDRKIIDGLAQAGLHELDISLHIDVDRDIISYAQDKIPLVQVYEREAEYTHDWGMGEYSGPLADGYDCLFKHHDTYVVLWDGRITGCCMESECSTHYTVKDLLCGVEHTFKPLPRCATCQVGPKIWVTGPILKL
jgi:hypothetical protein